MDALLFFQFLLCILGSILLVVLIVLGIKCIYLLDKINNVVDNVDKKVNSLNRLFDLIDLTTDKLSVLSDRVIDTVTIAIKKIFNRKRKEETEYEKY